MYLCSRSYSVPLASVTYAKVKRRCYRARQASIPNNAPDIPSIISAYSTEDIMQRFGHTTSGKRFYKTAFSNEQFAYCIFASDEIIEMFQERIPVERRDFLMDATFKICPFGVFNQLLVIYISYLEVVSESYSLYSNTL